NIPPGSATETTNTDQMVISEIPRSFLLTSLPPCNQIDGIITVTRDKLMTVLSAPEMRFGTKQDVPFIIAVIRDGMRDGYFNFDDDDGLSQFESQISEAIARRERGENCADFLFVFDAQHNGAAIGFALLTGKNGANGLASHLEIRMFGVTRSQRQKGFGRSMLQSILDATPGHKVEASCLPASVVMARMLTNAGFHVKEISPFGKRTFRR
ncbi:GNAT family N-acetyltransferase, partial [Enterobacter hormaechei]|uniref:GNAT family N-acetyltransferase n=1 Tax=Enterobacter hormaechei TaxID=158836 RepID=UPI003F437419